MAQNRRIAGFFRQIQIISWKNLLLYRQNISGLVCEILFSCLFTLIFVVLVYYSRPVKTYGKDFNPIKPMVYFKNDEIVNTTDYYYYPNNQFIREIVVKSTDKFLKFNQFLNLKFIGSDLSMPESINETIRNRMFAFVSFNFTSLETIPDAIEYSIHTMESSIVKTYKTSEKFRSKKDYLYENSPEYFCQNVDKYHEIKYSVFNTIKHSIDQVLIETVSNKPFNSTLVTVGSFSCPEYVDDIMKSQMGFFTSLLISLAFMVTFLVTVSSIIAEKESKMKEYLRLLGVKPVVIWLCWMMRSFIIYIIISAVVTITSTKRFKSNNVLYFNMEKALFLHTTPSIVFLTVIVYSIQCTSLSLLVGQIFSKSFTAKTLSIIFWFATLINFYNSYSSIAKYFFSIFPNSALSFAVQVMLQYERSGRKLGFSKLFVNLYDDELNLGSLLISMLMWSLVYLGLSWYIERILPGEFGVKQPWYFPFMKSYWVEQKSGRSDYDDNIDIEETQILDGFEREPSELQASVKIKNLTKVFRTGFEDKKAVDNMSLNFYENQITGFLGHNGAGKTTVTFILCGLYSPDKGTAKILGHDIRTHMEKIRTSIGFCPQNNILYDELTVRQHLDLVASVKGFSRNERENEINRISSYVGLQNDLSKKSRELSGGMKRRLSVAMALIGDSKVIILDEPTSGLDPYNRRSLWEIIRNYKTGRTIIISTHYMEEADALSDRIALMNHGQVKCCGSPLYLKDKFGSGYRLILTKDVNFNQNELENMVRTIFGENPNIQSNIAREMCISIPSDLNSKLPSLLNNIEKYKYKLGVLNYGISSATVEEVFLKIGSIDINEDIFSPNKNKNLTESITNQNLSNAFDINTDMVSEKNDGPLFYLQQINALMLKRLRIFTRRYMIFVFTLILPVLVLALLSSYIPSTSSLIADTLETAFGRKNIPSYSLDITNYGKQFVPYNIKGTNKDQVELDFKQFFSYKNASKLGLNLLPVQNVNDFVLQKRKEDSNNLISKYYFGIEIDSNNGNPLFIGRYSSLAFHSAATILNELDSLLFGFWTNNMKKLIKTINAPISVGASSSLPSNFSYDKLEVFSCLEIIPFSFLDYIIAIVIAFVISVTSIHLTREKRNGSKSLQLLSGTHYAIYWLSNYIFDFVVYFIQITTLLIALKLVALGLSDTANDTYLITYKWSTLADLFFFMIISSFTWSALSYIWSYLFKSDIVGFVVLFIVLSFATLVDMICVLLGFFDATSAVDPTSGETGTMGEIAKAIRIILIIFCPNIAIKRAVFNLKLQNTPICFGLLNILFQSKLSAENSGFDFNEPGIGKFAILNICLFFIANIFIFFMEDKFLGNLIHYIMNSKNKPNKNYLELEEDVRAESERIDKANIKFLSDNEPLVVSNLRKEFKKSGRKFAAVDNLSFGVLPGECFGLLGLNGAGKTTTIGILTGELRATSGDAFVNSYDINREKLRAIRSLGFCPQFEYLPEFLTVKQALDLFANLRGIKSWRVNKIVEEFISAFKLSEFRNKLVQNLSGGNKRKVSSAIAFIGKPKIVILDEPTSGMDPAARRYLWNVIKHARDMGMTVLLTTHSMEECEALCTKLGIMVNGQFQCFGNIQKLKSKYGKGYSLILKCKTLPSMHESIIEQIIKKMETFVQENIPNAVLKDRQQQTLFYQIIIENEESFSIARIFDLIESNKHILNLETYSVSQTSLEQVFLSFAKKQSDSMENRQSRSLAINNRIKNYSNPVFQDGQTDVRITLKDL
nr:ATP-binding cassette subfamily A3-like 4 [Brachionus rubens]